jgi:hypothetical protein
MCQCRTHASLSVSPPCAHYSAIPFKFHAYYKYCDSGQAARDYNGFPTLLFVTTDTTAERRIAVQAYRAWFICGAEPLPILITATDRISQHREGILGPIWRTPGPPNPCGNPVRQYWLPGGPPPGLFGTGRQPVRTPRLVWPTAGQLGRHQPKGDM